MYNVLTYVKRFGSIPKHEDYVKMANSQFKKLCEIHMLPVEDMKWNFMS